MKKALAFCILTALCVTCFASCDLSGGLIAELFGNNVGDYVPGDDVILVDPIDSVIYPDIGVGVETWTEIATEPPIEYPMDDTIGCETETYPTDCILPEIAPCMDGVLDEFWSNGWQRNFDLSNLDPWLGEVGENGGFTMYAACDSEYMYMAFDVRDTAVVYSDDNAYNGDCFQIQIDFNGWIGQTGEFERGIFYSFGLQEDGTVDVTVQSIHGDASSTEDYKMASDDHPAWREGEILGATKVKDDGSGWIAEFAISWDTLYRDVCEKLAPVGVELPAVETWAGERVELNMLVTYLDYAGSGEITGAWGTSKVPGSLASGQGWYPENCDLRLAFDPGFSSVFTEDEGR